MTLYAKCAGCGTTEPVFHHPHTIDVPNGWTRVVNQTDRVVLCSMECIVVWAGRDIDLPPQGCCR